MVFLPGSHVPKGIFTKENRYWGRQLAGFGSLKFINERKVHIFQLYESCWFCRF